MLKFQKIQEINVHNYKELKKDHDMWNKVNIYKFSKKKKKKKMKKKEKEEETIRVKRSGFVKCKYGRQICIKRNI